MRKFEAPNDHPIFDALISGDVASVVRYLKEGVDPYRNGVISAGIRGGHVPVVDAMLANGVDPNKPIVEAGATPLMRAIEKRQMPVIRFLLEKGADINGGLGEGATPLFFAVNYFPESIPFLLERGAILDARDPTGRTPFKEACRLNRLEAVESLFIAGADIESADNSGTTALLSSVRSGAEDAMRWLIAHGADIHAKDKRGRSAVWWAEECKRPEIAEFLRGLGIR